MKNRSILFALLAAVALSNCNGGNNGGGSPPPPPTITGSISQTQSGLVAKFALPRLLKDEKQHFDSGFGQGFLIFNACALALLAQ